MGVSTCAVVVLVMTCCVGGGDNTTNRTLSTLGPDTTPLIAPTIVATPAPAGVWPDFCPPPCACETRRSSVSQAVRRTIDCGRQGISTLPSNITGDVERLVLSGDRFRLDGLGALDSFSNLTEVDLSSNHMYAADGWPPLPGLRHLALGHNQIDYLQNRSFTELPGLVYLSLTGNKVELMNKDCFRGLTALTTLDLSDNRIFSLNNLWWRDLVSLHTLNIKNNNIHTIEDGAFATLSSLRMLDLAGNMLKHVHKGAFQDVEGLEELRLEGNPLKESPTLALARFTNLGVLDLSGTHLVRLETGAIQGCNVSVLRLSGLPVLQMVSARALVKLPTLRRLEMTGNKALQYIDGSALSGLPSLTTLQLHGNNLTVLESDVIAGIPHLASLSLHNNPLVCDCNLAWLRSTNISLEVAPVCGTDGRPLSNALAEVGTSCAPRILPLYGRTYETVLGDRVRLDCRAVGVPRPQTDWLLPSHHGGEGAGVRLVSAGVQDGHIEVSPTGTLYIHYIQGPDHGDYTCLAANPHGRAERHATIHVKNMRANVIIIRVTSTAVTVTWRSTRYTHDYQILYRQSDSNDTYHTVDIKPYMRTYTASELCPRCMYEFCIAVRHEARPVRINCTAVQTRQEDYGELRSSRSYIIGGASATLVILVTVACGATWLVRRYNKRRRQREELYSDNLSQLFLASIDSMSDTTPITYENRGAEMFDDDDIEEIRSTASMASTSSISGSARC